MKKLKLNKIAFWLLNRFRKSSNHESLFGDYEEMFQLDCQEYGSTIAEMRFWSQVIKALPTFIANSFYWSMIMFKNYLKIAFRYLLLNRVFSFVNISGLALGFTCFILLSLYVLAELNFDRFHRDSEHIFRIVQQIEDQNGDTRKVAGVAAPIGPTVVDQFPEVQSQTRIIEIGRLTVGNDPMNRDYERIWIADANFFDFFDFQFIYGDAQSALTKPDNLVITESIARKYFGKTDIVGERLYTNVYEATVAGVIRDFPTNSHIQINTIHAVPTWKREIDQWNEWVTTNWTSNGFITYLKMEPNFDKQEFEQKLTKLVTRNYNEEITYTCLFTLQCLKDIHLHSQDIQGGINVNKGNPLYIYMFSVIAFLLLLIACFNYMNLSTAAASKRMREVGIRKTIGAGKFQLVQQFTSEAILLSVFSLLLAFFLIKLILPFAQHLTGKEFSIEISKIPMFIGLSLIALIAGIISALYPSFFLSRLNPARILTGEIKILGDRLSLKKMVIVVQFVISIIMISTTITIYQQLKFLQEKELGFEMENLLVVDINSGILRSKFESIKQEFLYLSEVKNVTVSSRVPGEWKVFPIANVEHRGSSEKGQMIFVGIDEDFLNTFDIELLQGRQLRNDPADSNSVLLTESAVKQLGLINPIGEVIEIAGTIWAGDLAEQDHPYNPQIVGVVRDFYFQSFRKKKSPIMLASYRNPIHNIDYYTLRIQTNNWQKTLSHLQTINHMFDPENPLEYTFLDNQFEQFYKDDHIRARLFLVFSGIIIFIACMGFFAIASLAIEHRIKEIGIRKILGASIKDIVWLLWSNFSFLIGLAFILSVPVAWWAVERWLEEFAYRITPPLWAFPVAGLMAFIIALGTITFQTLKAATMNPANSLRNE